MPDYDLIGNLMLIACAIGAVFAIRYQRARRCVPSSRAAQAGASPKAFYCNVPACFNYAPSGRAKALTHRPPHACRLALIGASHRLTSTTHQRARQPTGNRNRRAHA